MAGLMFPEILRKGLALGKVPGKQESRAWFREQAQTILRVNTKRLMKDPNTKLVAQIEIGRMYAFMYDPKWKKELPYYDKFPLIFPFSIENDRMRGLNMHYLWPAARARLMDELYGLRSRHYRNKNTDSTFLRLTYQLLKGASRFRWFKPCVKEYLFSHVRSEFLEIPYEQWDIALFLPMARFEKKSKDQVWKESAKIINGR